MSVLFGTGHRGWTTIITNVSRTGHISYLAGHHNILIDCGIFVIFDKLRPLHTLSGNCCLRLSCMSVKIHSCFVYLWEGACVCRSAAWLLSGLFKV